MPSRASSEANTACETPACSASRPASSSAAAETRLICSTASGRLLGELARPRPAPCRTARGRRRARLTSPSSYASAASIGSPVRFSSSACASPDQPRQPLGAAEARDDPEVDLGLAEARRLRGDPEVAGHRQLAAAAEGERVDRGDRDDRRALELAAAARACPSSSARPAAASISVNALMSAPAQNSIGLAEAKTSARTAPSAADRVPRPGGAPAPPPGRSSWPAGGRARRSRPVPAVSSLTGLSSQPGVGPGIGKEALARSRPEAALGDEPAEDRRRREPLAPLARGALQPLEHRVEAELVGARERAAG